MYELVIVCTVLFGVVYSLVLRPMYRKHFGMKFRVKTVIVQGVASHYYAEFKPGYNYNWGIIEKTACQYRIRSNWREVIPFVTFNEAEDLCRRYKEYRIPGLSDVSEETYTAVCEDD